MQFGDELGRGGATPSGSNEQDENGEAGQGGTEGISEDAASAGDSTTVVYFMLSGERDEGRTGGGVDGAEGEDDKPVQAACVVCAGDERGEKRYATVPERDGTGVAAA